MVTGASGRRKCGTAGRPAYASYISFRLPSRLSANPSPYPYPRPSAPRHRRAYGRTSTRTRRNMYFSADGVGSPTRARRTKRSDISRGMVSPARRSVACRRSSPQRRSRLSHGEITLFTHSKTTFRYDHSVLIENAVKRERAVPLNRAFGVGHFADGFEGGARRQ